MARSTSKRSWFSSVFAADKRDRLAERSRMHGPKARLNLEALEDRTLMTISGAVIAGQLNAFSTQVDLAFEAAKDDVANLSQKIEVFGDNLDNVLKLGQQINTVVAQASDVIDNFTALQLDTQGELDAALAQIGAQTGGRVVVARSGNFSPVDLGLAITINPGNVPLSIPLDSDLTLMGITFNTPNLGTLTISNNLLVKTTIHIKENPANSFSATVIPALTSVVYTPTFNLSPVGISGTVAGVLSYNGTLGVNLAPTVTVGFGNSSTGTSLSGLISLADGSLANPTLAAPVSFTITTPALPNFTYKTSFSLDITNPTSITRSADQLFLGNQDVTNAASGGADAWIAAVLQKAAGPLLDRVASFIPPELSDLLLGETVLFANVKIKDVMHAIDLALLGGAGAALGFDTPIDLIKLIPGLGQGAAGVVEVVETILKASDLAKKVKDPANNGGATAVKQLAEKSGFEFALANDPVGTVFKLLSKQETNLVTWTLDMSDKLAEAYGIPKAQLKNFINNNPAINRIIKIAPSPSDPNIDRIEITIDPASLINLVTDMLGPVGNRVKQVLSKLGIDLSGLLGIKGFFAAQAGVTVGIDSSFIEHGYALQNIADGLLDSFFINSKNLIDMEFSLTVTQNFPGPSPSGAALFGGGAAFAAPAAGSRFSIPKPKKPKLPTLNDVKREGENFIHGVGQGASDGLQDLGQLGVDLKNGLVNVLGKLARASVSFGIQGRFNLGLNGGSVEPDKLTANEALSQLRNDPLGLVVATGGVHAFAQATGVIVGIPFSKRLDAELLSFGNKNITVNGVSQGAAANLANLFAERIGTTLFVYDNAQSSTYNLDAANGKIRVRRGGAELLFDAAAVGNVVVLLNGGTRPGGGTSTFALATGGNDRVYLHPSLPAVKVTVAGGTGNDIFSGNVGTGFFAGEIDFDGGVGQDELRGGSGFSLLKGGTQNDTLIAGAGMSDLYGNDGDDTLRGLDEGAGAGPTATAGLMVGGQGKDDLTAGTINRGDWTMIGGSATGFGDPVGTTEASIMVGGYGHDLLISGDATLNFTWLPLDNSGGLSLLFGGAGNDTLFGGNGDDTLIGGWINGEGFSGVDILNGAGGKDTLILSHAGPRNIDTLVPYEIDAHLGAGATEYASGGDGDDTFLLGTNSARVEADGGAHNDSFFVSTEVDSSLGSIAGITGLIDIDAGSGDDNQIVVDNQGGPATGNVIVTDESIRGMTNIDYRATRGNFRKSGTGIALVASQAADTVTIESTLAGSITTIFGNGGNDIYNVGDASDSLDGIQGELKLLGDANEATPTTTLEAGANSNEVPSGDRVRFNDHGDTDGHTYILDEGSLTRSGLPLDISFTDFESVSLRAGKKDNIIDITTTGLSSSTIVNGGDQVDTVTIFGTGRSSNLIVNTAAGEDLIKVLSTATGSIAVVEAGSANDIINVGSVGNSLDFILGALRVNGGAEELLPETTFTCGPVTNSLPTGDTVSFNDQGDSSTGVTYELKPTTLGRTGLAIPIIYESTETIILNMGSQDNFLNIDGTAAFKNTFINGADKIDTINILSTGARSNLGIETRAGMDTLNVRSTGAGSITDIDAGADDDLARLSSNAGINDDGNLDGLAGAVCVDGGAGDNNRLIVSDFGGAPNANVVLTADGITGFGPSHIGYEATGGHFNTAGADGILLRGSNNGADTFNVHATLGGSTTKIEGHLGSDVFNIGKPGNSLDDIQGALLLSGDANLADPKTTLSRGRAVNRLAVGDIVNFNDQGDDTAGLTYTLTATTVQRTGTAVVTYGTLETVNLNSGLEAAIVDVLSTAERVNTTVNANAKGDTVNVLTTGASSNVVVNGNFGSDTVNLRTTGRNSFTFINGSADNDFIHLSSVAGLGGRGSVSDVNGVVSIDAGSGAANRLVVDDFAGLPNFFALLTNSYLFGLAPAAIYYAATGGSFTNGAVNDGVLVELSNRGRDTIRIQSTLLASTTKVNGWAGDDQVFVSSDAPRNIGNLDGIRGTLTVDAGAGKFNHLVVSDFAGAPNPNAIVTKNSITGLAPASIFYLATDGRFHRYNSWDGILIRGSNLGVDTFLVPSTLKGSSTRIQGFAGGDLFNVGSTAAVNLGDFDQIQGRLTIDSGAGIDRIYSNDRGKKGRANYSLTPDRLVQFDLPKTMVPPKPLLGVYNPPRPIFAGVFYDGTSEFFRLDGTDDVNIADIKPSLATEYHLDGNLPPSGSFQLGGGDYLRLDTNGTRGRTLYITALGQGFWGFSTPHKRVYFESIERFNHVEAFASVSGNRIVVRDAETGDVKFQTQPYESFFDGGARVAMADVNFDGLPDLLVVPGQGRAPTFKVYNGTPNGQGTYVAGLLASYDVFAAPFKDHGVHVAVGDVNGDGANDVAFSGDGGWIPQVKVFDGRTLLTSRALVGSPFNAFSPSFNGGVRLAVGDLDNVGRAEVIAATGPGTTAAVNIFTLNGNTFTLIKTVKPAFAGADGFKGGASVTVGDFNHDQVRDLIISAGEGWTPMVTVLNGNNVLGNHQVLTTFLAFDAGNGNGVRASAKPVDGGDPGFIEKVSLLLSSGPKGGAASRKVLQANFRNGLTPQIVDKAFEDSDFDGIYLG